MVEIGKYIGFCVYRRSYLIWSPVVVAGCVQASMFEVVPTVVCRSELLSSTVCLSVCLSVTYLGDCESCARPVFREPASTEAGEQQANTAWDLFRREPSRGFAAVAVLIF